MNAPSSQQLPHSSLSRTKFQMLPGTAECPWSSLPQRKGSAQMWLSYHQKAFGIACDHHKIISYLQYHGEESRVLQAPDGDRTNCASPWCHSPMSPPGPSLAYPQHKKSLALFKLLQLFQLLQLSLSHRSIKKKNPKQVFILRTANTEVCAVPAASSCQPKGLHQHTPSALWMHPCLPLDASHSCLCQQAASEDGSEWFQLAMELVTVPRQDPRPGCS